MYHLRMSRYWALVLWGLAQSFVCLSAASITFAGDQARQDELAAGFARPPQAAKPAAYWLWLNGYANREYFEQELKAFAEKGIGGLCIFDMGARGDKRFFPPAGPAFMSDESLETITQAIKTARKYGLDVQLAACSSWDLGGSWVTPEHASMALYRSEVTVEGPASIDRLLPSPALPPGVPKRPDGTPAFLRDIAVLALPETHRQPAHEFIYRLPRGDLHQVNRVVLYNTESDDAAKFGKMHLFAKQFSVAVSTTGKTQSAFKEIVSADLLPRTAAQTFDFPATTARYVRLRIFNGHNTRFDQVQLGEFEVYATNGVNVGASFHVDRTRDTAELVWFNSEANAGGNWTADRLNDGAKSPAGSWRSAGQPPLLIESPSAVVDVTSHLTPDGRLQWQVPPGKWTLMRFVCGNTGELLKVPSPNSDGLATDHFNADATRTFIRTLTSRLEAKLGDLQAAGLKQLYLPSYEVRGAKWTPDFVEQFSRYRDYDMTPYLPVLAGCQIENDERTFRFLYDFQKTLGQLLVDAYYRTASDTAHEAGVGIEAEAGGPGPPVHQVPVDALQALGAIDEMRGEFWPWRPDRDQLWVVKETAAAAHVYGRSRVHMESFTGFRHWEDGPFELKPSADRAFCEGMNHVVWHTSSHQPPESGKPGWVYGAGTHLTPNLAWWSLSKPFIDYLARCSFMLQQGHFVADVCYYYGDQGANFVPPKHVDPSLGPGYDYDVANPEVVLQRMSVHDGRIVLPDGMQYELLVLPDREDCDLAVLRKIEELVKSGATVVGRKPISGNGLSDFPQRDAQVAELADTIWGACDGRQIFENRYGRGRVIWGRDLSDILHERGLGPDFGFEGAEPNCKVDFIHRRTSTADIYFVRNMQALASELDATFRVFDRTPELWSADTGRISEQPVFECTAQGTTVPLSLPPLGSLFVVFRDALPDTHLSSVSSGAQLHRKSEKTVQLTAGENGVYELRTSHGRVVSVAVDDLPAPAVIGGPWRVEFPPNWGAPTSETFNQLVSFTQHANPGIKHFSGLARYRSKIDIPAGWLSAGRRVDLDLGRLWAVGKVHLNGHAVATVWKPPYRVDITQFATPGSNFLDVEIANTWSNRLVGDSQLPVADRYCRTNIVVSGSPSRPWSQVPLRESGLFGPVRLVPMAVREVTVAE